MKARLIYLFTGKCLVTYYYKSQKDKNVICTITTLIQNKNVPDPNNPAYKDRFLDKCEWMEKPYKKEYIKSIAPMVTKNVKNEFKNFISLWVC